MYKMFYVSSEICSPLLVRIGRETAAVVVVGLLLGVLIVFVFDLTTAAPVVVVAVVPNRAARELGFKI